MKRLGLSSAIEHAAGGIQQAALGQRYIATVQSVTGRETTGWVICDVFFRDPAAEGRQTVRVNASVDLAANDLIYIKPDPAGQRTFIFDGFVKGGGTGNNDAGAFIPWTQAPGATSPVGMDYEITPASGQDTVIEGLAWSSLIGLDFVLMSNDIDVANERALAVGDGISLTDGGAGGAATLAVDLVAAWNGLEFSGGKLRVDLDTVFDFTNDVSVAGDLSVGTITPNYTFELRAASGDNPKFAMSSDAVNQPITAVASANVFGMLSPVSATAGGIEVFGFSDTDATAMIITGFMGTANPTDTIPAITMTVYKSDGGTSIAALAAAETVLQIQNSSTALMTILGDGRTGFGTSRPHAMAKVDIRGAGAATRIRVGYNTTDSVRFDLIADAASTRMVAYDDNAAAYVSLDFRGDPVLFSIGVTEIARVLSSGLFINETANAKMAMGLTINQGANDDELIAGKSSDVAHGMTDLAETDTCLVLSKASGVAGGAQLVGYRDADDAAGRALTLVGRLGEAADTTKSTAGLGIVAVFAQIKSGAGAGAPGADENLLSIHSHGNTRLLLDQEGEIHTDAVIGIGDDWDEWDDLALAADLSRLPRAKYDEMLTYHAEDFERAGLVTLSVDEDGQRHAFIRHKAMLMFGMNCFREIHHRMQRYEHALIGLGVDPQRLEV